MTPTLANGKICYIELPADDVPRSSAFYAAVFGWTMRKRRDGTQAFDDTTGEVSGSFRSGRKPYDAPGLIVYIMVDDAAATCKAIEAHGGTIVQEIGADHPEITARFRDPGGNVLGLYQSPAA